MKGGDSDGDRLGMSDGGMTQNLMPWDAGLPPALRRPEAVRAPIATAVAPRVQLDDSRRKRSVPYVRPPDIPIGRHRAPGVFARLRAWMSPRAGAPARGLDQMTGSGVCFTARLCVSHTYWPVPSCHSVPACLIRS